MKVAIVHDYIKEYGGAERVLRTLADIYPKAPIYTAFRVRSSTADNEFKDRKIVLTGAMKPYEIDKSEASFNLGMAMGFLKAKPKG